MSKCYSKVDRTPAKTDFEYDTDYDEESFFRHAYFLGANDPYGGLKTTLKAEIDEAA